MSTLPRAKRVDFFGNALGAAEFQKSFSEYLRKVQKHVISKHVSPENTQHLRHGGTWVHPGLPNAINGEIQRHSSIAEISFNEIVGHDLSAIDRVVKKIVLDMERQFAQMMYATLSAACEQTGNIVDAKASGSIPEAFAEVIEKIQFSADKFGKVNLPEIHVSPEMAERLRATMINASPEFLQRMENIKSQKITEAVDREAERKSRFVRYGVEE